MIAATIRRWAAQARAWQQAALADFSALDEACRDHMAHGAMAGADPLTDSLYAQLEGPAAEGAHQPTPYTDGITPKPEHRGWWIAAVTLLAALVSVALLLPARA